MKKTIRLPVLVIVVISVCTVWILFTLWQSNRISPQFQTLSKLAYRSVRECHDKVAEEGPSFSRCLDVAQMLVVRVGQLARTQRERKQYADLHNFLTDVSDYHQRLSASTSPNELSEIRENLNRFRKRLEETFR